MYSVSWMQPPNANRTPSQPIKGLSRHATKTAAEAQVAKWQAIFTRNRYFIVKTAA